jgi:DNA-directed RNA polymerase specialized sigma subunit
MKELTKATKRDKEDPYDPADLDSVMVRDGSEKSPLEGIMFGEDLSLVEDALDKIDDEKAKKIIRMRYFEGEGKKPTPFLSLKDEVGLSRWGVIMAHNRGIDKVRKRVKKSL